MNIAICDDELNIVLFVQSIVKKYIESTDKIFIYTDYTKMKKELQRIDILFMDIRLNEKSGIKYIKDNISDFKDTILIYMTGYDEYIEDAFETDPIYILRKPLTEEKVHKALSKAMEKLNSLEDYFVLKNTKEVMKIKYRDLLFVESEGRIMNFHTSNGVIKKYGKLKEIESILGSNFIKIHKSYLVNINKIKVYKPTKIILENGTELPISRTYVKECREKVLTYLES